jgi:hypothetical protein
MGDSHAQGQGRYRPCLEREIRSEKANNDAVQKFGRKLISFPLTREIGLQKEIEARLDQAA